MAPPAHAQEQPGNVALDQLDPAPSGDDFFQVQSYRAGRGSVELSMMLLGEYAREPLTVYDLENGEEGRAVAAVVSDQLFLHVGGSLGFYERLQLSIDFPMAVLNRGDDVDSQGVTITAPSGTSVGDLRLGMRLRLFGDPRSPIGLAIGGYLFAPTGDETEFTSTGHARGNPSLMLGGRAGPVLWGLNTGVMIQERATFGNTRLGTELTFGGGLALITANDALQIGPELYGSTLLDKGDDKDALPPFDSKDTHLEGLLGLKGRIEPVVLGAAVGPGFTKGMGTPELRAVLSVAYAPREADRDHDGVLDEDDACRDVPGVRSSDPATNGCPVSDQDKDGVLDVDDACPAVPGERTSDRATNGCPDTDHDGIFDARDACPTVAGVANPDPKKHGCPLPDRVGDGILDDNDACPDVKGVASSDPARNGCPPDRDGDGIADDKDACPDVKGVASSDPARNGCPPDTDGDGITDDKDACKTEPGKPNADPEKNGCPMVFLRGARIVISEQVQFKTASDVILPASDELLGNVAKVFAQHSELTKVLIEGHTDSVGKKDYNLALSNRRAASVRNWLVKHGVDVNRLQSKGFGLEQPIADNATPEGRQINRRVEFKVLEGAKQPDVGVQTTGTAPPPAPQKK
ncbi:MAG: OmpA family protein [Polyangiaceae bacterium]